MVNFKVILVEYFLVFEIEFFHSLIGEKYLTHGSNISQLSRYTQGLF